MFRLRRYRVFLIAAALSVASIFYFSSLRHTDIDHLRNFNFGQHLTDKSENPSSSNHQSNALFGSNSSPTTEPESKLASTPTTASQKVLASKLDDLTQPTPISIDEGEGEIVTGEELMLKQPDHEKDFKEITRSQFKGDHAPGEVRQSRWEAQEEHNPIPEEKVIRLPKGKPSPLAKVQHDFTAETSTEKSDRLRKLVAIREAFRRAWQDYEEFAMPHDELLAVSKSYGDSFMGWGATLVDSLDALWIMDLKDEFENAVNATSKIDFKTSHKKEIPLFETVIRILGGLVSAYDVSEGHYPVLLEKAVELADILMGAFDTPNRLPDLYYKWAPSYASQQHRAGPRVVAAELGSLSLEFTRLAQITKLDRYYDAIARVQNALEDWQMQTEMPGLFPLHLDASGCKKTDQVKVESDSDENNEKPILIDASQISEEDLLTGETPADLPRKGGSGLKMFKKRQVDDISQASRLDTGEQTDAIPASTSATFSPESTPISESTEDEFCLSQGLSYEPYARKLRFGIGAMADSMYEYMPKMHRLLGGLSTQYESMYRNAAKAIRKDILYRPMIGEENRKILFPAFYEYDNTKKVLNKRVKVNWEGSHLGCFAGGMFGLAAKTFGISSDMELAKQLTDGCIWAYESTPTKIMPDKFSLTRCEDPESCPWDESKWHEALDPNLKERQEAVKIWNSEQKKLYQQTGMTIDRSSGAEKEVVRAAKPLPSTYGGEAASDSRSSDRSRSYVKRDPPVNENPTKTTNDQDNRQGSGPHLGFVPKIATSHESYVKARIVEERLPPGYTKIYDRAYKLRPEAIESVFIMWRMTGDDYWRRKGWMMFQAIQEATHAEAGNAQIEDVTSVLGEKVDTMDSFFLAETLKYFYLLFSEPDVISLDEYVLNTEAHPFKMPTP